MKEILIELFKTETLQNAIFGVIVYMTTIGLGKLFTQKPEWEKYKGSILSAIKQAEKAIPDGTENKSLARLDFALQYVIKVAEESGKKLTADQVAAIREGISIVHDEVTE